MGDTPRIIGFTARSGRPIYPIAGGDGTGDGGTGGSGGDGGAGDGGDAGKGKATADELKALQDDRDKWKTMARKHEDQAKKNSDELKKLQDAQNADKSESDKLKERVAEMEKKQADAEARALRAEVAAEKKLPPALAKRLSGSTREEMEADADDLLEAVKPTGTEGEGDGNGEGGSKTRKPREALRAGASSADGDKEPTAKDLIDSTPR